MSDTDKPSASETPAAGAWPPPWGWGPCPYPWAAPQGHDASKFPPPGWYPPPWTVPGPAPAGHHADHHALIAGLVVGAAAAYLLSNEAVQRSMIGSVVSLWSTLQGGVEEMKERFRDAEAERAQAQAPAEPATDETA